MTIDIRDEIIAALPRLRKFAFALTGCPDRAEDLVQDTCVRALDRAHQWQAGTRMDSWLYRIAQNRWIDMMRSRANKSEARLDEAQLPDERSASVSPAGRHEHNAVRRSVAALPAEQRAIVALVCVNGCSYREASEILDIPIGTVMSRLARARKTIHRDLYGEEAEPERSAS